MSLIKKSDVKNHLSTRTGASELPVQPVSQPDATGYSGDGSEDAAPVLLTGTVARDASLPVTPRGGKTAAPVPGGRRDG
jgi:hypothetical protein